MLLVIVILLCAIFYVFICAPIINAVYSIMRMNSYGRTEKGEAINKKIEGLKQYMSDYTSLSEKGKDELIIWEEYLIYSVIFGLNDTIVKEMSELIDINERN